VISERDSDRILIVSVLLLVSVGVVMVLSTSYVVALKRVGDEYYYVKKHLVFVFMGLSLFVAGSRIPYHIYRKLAYPLLIVAAICLALVLIPGIGHKVGGARRWLGVAGFTFQPSELAKFATVVFLAYSLEAKKDYIQKFSTGFLPNIIIPGALLGLIVIEPDLGTTVTIAMIVGIMCFVGGVRLSHMALIGAAGACAALFVISKFAYMKTRILVFLDPWKYPDGAGFQTIQSFLAFGSGGISGVGLGDGKQKLFYLPEAHTDYIFSVIGEETGLLGVMFVVVLYAAILVSGLKIAAKTRDAFGSYLALGITLMLVLQAAINMAVVMGALPPKGLPLPFISYGGTSLLMSLFAAGVLLNVCIRGNEA